jgi:hypothetical protein
MNAEGPVGKENGKNLFFISSIVPD